MPDRFLNLTGGTAMIASDLHGDRDAFDRCLRRFAALRESGQAERIIFLGDLIHGDGQPHDDASLSMILDMMALREQLGPDAVIMLLGNHEMPHIYGVTLTRGSLDFTPRFEHALGPHRDAVIAFLNSLPFYVRTAAGVMLSHAGPSPDVIAHADLLREFSHQEVLEQVEAVLNQVEDTSELTEQYRLLAGVPYDEMAREYLAISGPDDPRYLHLLRGFLVGRQSREFNVLWAALFTLNERGLSPTSYRNSCRAFLEAFSEDAPVEQRAIVSGHIATPRGGHTLVNDYHLRIASATHARPREQGEYLLLDCAAPVRSASDLLGGLRNLFE
ncbi:MAG: metallophosphoesterase [Anaerolineae bacterium]|nr:metallophosphoesterase [Anaerolineae bacterium]